ncbi:MAG: AraC family transcriptional regulator [Herbinix sp.]|jgi:AraC-like DNA-binding protein|nr:AraC family transcriptional regulator [Herbinix sp.]
MRYLDYKEHRQQGTYEFPLAFYQMGIEDYRYQMTYHWHTEYEIILIKEGNFRLTLDGQLYQGQKGDIYFVPAGVLHGGVPEGCIYECIVFDMKLLLGGNHICNKWLQKIIKKELRLPFIISELDVIITQTALSLFSLLEKQERGYEFLVQGSLYQLFGLLYEFGCYSKYEELYHEYGKYMDRLKRVITYIEDNYTETITLDSLSEIADLNPRYFCRFFKKLTDRTPIEYLNYYRIECACSQLIDRELPITEVAYNCGFNDSSYFIKVFHDAKGMTPRQYRKLEEIV